MEALNVGVHELKEIPEWVYPLGRNFGYQSSSLVINGAVCPTLNPFYYVTKEVQIEVVGTC